jgi:hypothetical protein
LVSRYSATLPPPDKDRICLVSSTLFTSRIASAPAAAETSLAEPMPSSERLSSVVIGSAGAESRNSEAKA